MDRSDKQLKREGHEAILRLLTRFEGCTDLLYVFKPKSIE